MARPRRMQRLNDAKSEVIADNVLKENPEGLPPIDDTITERVVISPKLPEYREVQFLNGRDPGYPLDFHYSTGTHPLKIYKLLHGHTYKLPLEVIEHLEGCNEPQYAYRRGADGHPEMYVVSRKYVFQCRNVPKKAA